MRDRIPISVRYVPAVALVFLAGAIMSDIAERASLGLLAGMVLLIAGGTAYLWASDRRARGRQQSLDQRSETTISAHKAAPQYPDKEATQPRAPIDPISASLYEHFVAYFFDHRPDPTAVDFRFQRRGITESARENLTHQPWWPMFAAILWRLTARDHFDPRLYRDAIETLPTPLAAALERFATSRAGGEQRMLRPSEMTTLERQFVDLGFASEEVQNIPDLIFDLEEAERDPGRADWWGEHLLWLTAICSAPGEDIPSDVLSGLLVERIPEQLRDTTIRISRSRSLHGIRGPLRDAEWDEIRNLLTGSMGYHNEVTGLCMQEARRVLDWVSAQTRWRGGPAIPS